LISRMASSRELLQFAPRPHGHCSIHDSTCDLIGAAYRGSPVSAYACARRGMFRCRFGSQSGLDVAHEAGVAVIEPRAVMERRENFRAGISIPFRRAAELDIDEVENRKTPRNDSVGLCDVEFRIERTRRTDERMR